MPNRHCLSFVIGLILLFNSENVQGAKGYHYPFDHLCHDAELIVEGTSVGDNKFQVRKIYKSPADIVAKTKTITVENLDNHDKELWTNTNGFATASIKHQIKTNKAVLFLKKNKKNKWESIFISHSKSEGTLGSDGLFWFDEATCYSYQQANEDGTLRLVPAKEAAWRTPATIKLLRIEIDKSLEYSRLWKQTLAIKNKQKKAIELTKFLVKQRQSLQIYHNGCFYHQASEAMNQLGKDAAPAVPILIKILKTAPPKIALDPVVLSLRGIGPAAKPAVPLLCQLLSSPDRVHAIYIMETLRAIGDPTAIPSIRPFLKHKNINVVAEAKKTLRALQQP